MYYSETTICAISTPPGMGGIAVIRLSGPAAFSICDKIFFPARKEASLSEAKSHTLLYGEIRDNNETVDEVVIDRKSVV